MNAWKRAQRAALLSLGVAFLVAVGCIAFTSANVRSQEEPSVSRTDVLGLTIFEAEKSVEGDGTSFTLRPGWGAGILLVLVPAAIGASVYLLDRRRQARYS